MASDDMVKEIVNRVMTELAKGEGLKAGAGPGAGAGGGRGLRRAPQEVRGNMASALSSSKKAGYVPGGAAKRDGDNRCLVVMTAGDGRLDEVHRQLGVLSEEFQEVDVFFSPSAGRC